MIFEMFRKVSLTGLFPCLEVAAAFPSFCIAYLLSHIRLTLDHYWIEMLTPFTYVYMWDDDDGDRSKIVDKTW